MHLNSLLTLPPTTIGCGGNCHRQIYSLLMNSFHNLHNLSLRLTGQWQANFDACHGAVTDTRATTTKSSWVTLRKYWVWQAIGPTHTITIDLLHPAEQSDCIYLSKYCPLTKPMVKNIGLCNTYIESVSDFQFFQQNVQLNTLNEKI